MGYLELLNQRVTSNIQPTAIVKVCLAPDLIGVLNETRASLEDAKKRGNGRNAAKINARDTIAALSERVEDLEKQVEAVTIKVVLKALTAGQGIKVARNYDEKTPAGEMWAGYVKAGFDHAETLTGDPIIEITSDHWSDLVDHASIVEIESWYRALDEARVPANL